MADNILELNDDNFNSEVIDAGTLVLVDFWAPWCGPCRMIAPTVEEIASEYAGKIAVGKVNTDESPQISVKHGISSIPTLMLFKGGEVVDKVVGAAQKSQLTAMIDKHSGTVA